MKEMAKNRKSEPEAIGPIAKRALKDIQKRRKKQKRRETVKVESTG
jgi:hypothetical protein